ncbi:MAG: SAM-dependent methyltransferase [Dehalococcoidia bacterium]|nr:SAM-dependent methyltransferase [Dehalococcoidia bacterium]
MSIDLDPGKAALGNAQLVRAIIDDMASGAITFERYMELALYHPEHGYYRKAGRIGPQGDFLTSPVIHPMFGWAVAGWCHAAWKALGQPREFTIFEPAAGSGALATAVLDWAESRDDGFREALRYVAIEPNAQGNEPRAEWVAPPIAPAACGVVVSNELFDAFPVRLFEGSERGPVEIGVRWDGEAFQEVHLGVASIDDAPETGRFEVNAHAYPAMRSLCQLVERGAVLTFDYGYPQDELWAPWRTTGTLLCFYRHTAHEDPYVHVGEQDMTTHVNFSELASAAEDEGMAVHGPVSQSAFLFALGLGGLVESARADMGEYFARRRAFQQLTDGAGLGRVRVLAATRGIGGELPGFAEGGP